eukprot:gene57775-biopygen116231
MLPAPCVCGKATNPAPRVRRRIWLGSSPLLTDLAVIGAGTVACTCNRAGGLHWGRSTTSSWTEQGAAAHCSAVSWLEAMRSHVGELQRAVKLSWPLEGLQFQTSNNGRTGKVLPPSSPAAQQALLKDRVPVLLDDGSTVSVREEHLRMVGTDPDPSIPPPDIPSRADLVEMLRLIPEGSLAESIQLLIDKWDEDATSPLEEDTAEDEVELLAGDEWLIPHAWDKIDVSSFGFSAEDLPPDIPISCIPWRDDEGGPLQLRLRGTALQRQMRVISWNVENGLAAASDVSHFQSLIDARQPDVILLQEWSPKSKPPQPYIVPRALRNQQGRLTGKWATILVKPELEALCCSAAHSGSAGEGYYARLSIRSSNNNIHFISAHAPCRPHDAQDDLAFTEWVDSLDQDLHEIKIPGEPVLYGGDFNFCPFPSAGYTKRMNDDWCDVDDERFDYLQSHGINLPTGFLEPGGRVRVEARTDYGNRNNPPADIAPCRGALGTVVRCAAPDNSTMQILVDRHGTRTIPIEWLSPIHTFHSRQGWRGVYDLFASYDSQPVHTTTLPRWPEMHSDHVPIECNWDDRMPRIETAKLRGRLRPPRRGSEKYKQCVDSVSDFIVQFRDQPSASDSSSTGSSSESSTESGMGDIDALLNGFESRIKPFSSKAKPMLYQTTLQMGDKLRGWALVAAELADEMMQAGRADSFSQLCRSPTLEPLLQWSPLLRDRDPSTLPWRRIAHTLHQWTTQLDSNMRTRAFRERRRELYQHYADPQFVWKFASARMGRPPPQPVAIAIVDEHADLPPPSGDSFAFRDITTDTVCTIAIDQEQLRFRTPTADLGIIQGLRALPRCQIGILGPDVTCQYSNEVEPALYANLRDMARRMRVEHNIPSRTTKKKLISTAAQLKQELFNWMAHSATPAFPGPLESSPPYLDNACMRFRAWMDAARIRHLPELVHYRAAELAQPPSNVEILAHLRKSAGMAAGDDLCSWHILQDIDDAAKCALCDIIRAFWVDKYDSTKEIWDFPERLRRAWTSPIPKANYAGEVSRLRPISVTPALGRLISKVLVARLTKYIEASGQLSKWQHGFRRGRSTLHAVGGLQTYLARRGKAHVVSLDIQRAFDSVEPRLAMQYLDRLGVPIKLIHFLTAQIEGSTTRVWSAYGPTPSMTIQRGTRQGGCESPLLFLLLIDPLLHILSDKLACNERNRGGYLAAFADDLLIAHQDANVVRAAIRTVENYLCDIGCKLNKDKCEWMVVNSPSAAGAPLPFPEDTREVKKVPRHATMRYLGFLLTHKGRLRPGKQIGRTLHGAMKMLPGGGTSAHIARTVANGIIAGHLMYFGGLADYTRSMLQRLDSLARRTVRRCAGVVDKFPSRLLYQPNWPEGMIPAKVLYAAAIVHSTGRIVAAEYQDGITERWQMLQECPLWPRRLFAFPACSPDLGNCAIAERVLWATKELGLILVQPLLPVSDGLPNDQYHQLAPVIYYGESHAEFLNLQGAPSTQWVHAEGVPCLHTG